MPIPDTDKLSQRAHFLIDHGTDAEWEEAMSRYVEAAAAECEALLYVAAMFKTKPQDPVPGIRLRHALEALDPKPRPPLQGP